MNLQGTWYNELGSVLTIGNIQNGQFQLTYQTAVSASNCAQGIFQGTGCLNTGESGTTIGIAVSWQNNISNCESVTTWSGYLTGDADDPIIVAFWLLTSANPESSWASTLVGEDVFVQTPISDGQIRKNLMIKRHSHI